MDERKAFEAWADDQGFPLKRLETSDDYLDLRTQGPWEAWQARATLPQPAAQGETVSVRFDILYDYAQAHGLDFNGLCRTVRDAIAEGSAALRAAVHQPASQGEPLGVLTRGEGGAFRVTANGDALRAIYAMPPGEHLLYASLPPAVRSDEDIAVIVARALAAADPETRAKIEAVLIGPSAPAAPKEAQEPSPSQPQPDTEK